MKLDFIPLDKIVASKANMRKGTKAPYIADLLPSVRRRGILMPILVRPVAPAAEPADDTAERFEVIAGRRRWETAKVVASEVDSPEPMPCAIIEPGDDAAALEASMLENFQRLDPDEVTRWESFTRLVREGRTPEDIGLVFGLPELMVKRTLALGNLLPRIRDLYRAGKIDMVTVRHLTMASKSQQKSWLALADDPDGHPPIGHQLKAWLFGGQSIAARHALFDVAAYSGAIVADLFGEDGYFADADHFWTAQNEAIAARRAAYLDDGWSDALMVPPTEHFSSWEYAKTTKRKGGRVYIDVNRSGEVVFHEGYLSAAEARRAAKGSGSEPAVDAKPDRPEISGPMTVYCNLHRHAAVRAGLLDRPGSALRLLLAHAIAGSHLWRVSADPRSPGAAAVADSVETARAETVFDAHRRTVLATLGFDGDAPTVTGASRDVVALFGHLLTLDDDAVLAAIAVVVGETIASGSAVVEAVGLHLGTDMAAWWDADDAFFDLIRDREVIGRITAEVAGDAIAAANAGEKAKGLKAIVRDHLAGANGRTQVTGWVPRWMAFPPSAYTERGGVATVKAHADATRVRVVDAPDPDDPAPDAAGGAVAPPVATAPVDPVRLAA